MKPPRSLANEIAHALMEDCEPCVRMMRLSLKDARTAIEVCESYMLVNGPQALVDAVTA